MFLCNFYPMILQMSSYGKSKQLVTCNLNAGNFSQKFDEKRVQEFVPEGASALLIEEILERRSRVKCTMSWTDGLGKLTYSMVGNGGIRLIPLCHDGFNSDILWGDWSIRDAIMQLADSSWFLQTVNLQEYARRVVLMDWYWMNSTLNRLRKLSKFDETANIVNISIHVANDQLQMQIPPESTFWTTQVSCVHELRRRLSVFFSG